jgi:hypothetical protein
MEELQRDNLPRQLRAATTIPQPENHSVTKAWQHHARHHECTALRIWYSADGRLPRAAALPLQGGHLGRLHHLGCGYAALCSL